MFKFSSIQFLILVLLSVLLLSLFGSFSEGLVKSSSVLNMQSSSINRALSDKTKPLPPGSPPGTKEFIDKNLVYLETFAKRLTDLVTELSTTMDTTPVPITKIDELISKYKSPTGITITKINPDIGLSMAIVFDLSGIKQLASEVPKSIFDKYINYRIELMNALFSNIDEFLNLASSSPSVVIDKVQMKSKLNQYLVDFKQLQNTPPTVTTSATPVVTTSATPVVTTSATPTEIPIFQQNRSIFRGMFNWSFFKS
jgi:hypothetical protein